MITIKVIAAIAILFSLNLAASAQDKPRDTQPQSEPAKAPERCTSEQSGFRAQNGVNMFYVEVTSACAKAQRCTISAYVAGSRGAKTGQGILTLGKASPGQETKKTWSMKTAENGGMANMSWSCKDI